MKSIVVRAATTSLRLPLLALAVVAGPALRAVAWFPAIPVVVLGTLLASLIGFHRWLLRGVWFLARSALLAWLRPWLLALRVVTLPLRILVRVVRFIVR